MRLSKAGLKSQQITTGWLAGTVEEALAYESVFYCYKVIKLLGRLSLDMERCTLSLEKYQPRTGFPEWLKGRERAAL